MHVRTFTISPQIRNDVHTGIKHVVKKGSEIRRKKTRKSIETFVFGSQTFYYKQTEPEVYMILNAPQESLSFPLSFPHPTCPIPAEKESIIFHPPIDCPMTHVSTGLKPMPATEISAP